MALAEIAQDPRAPDFVQDPYPFYDRARAQGALLYWRDYAMPAAFSHAAVHALLRDARFGRELPPDRRPEVPPHLAPFYALETHSMLELDPPRHTRLRGLVLRAFTSRRIAALAPEIEALCHRLIDGFPADGPFDLLGHYATHLPVIVIARLLGVPECAAPDLLRWSNAMVAMYQARRSRAVEEAAGAASREFTSFLRAVIEDRRASPGDDLISHLIAAEEEGRRLSTDEMISTCVLLLNAGHEATVHSLGLAVKTLLERGLRAPALDDPALDAHVEEHLRFDPPLHMFTRYAREDVEVFGHRLRRGDPVALMLGAANRDPDRWQAPGTFDPARAVQANAAFGGGIHFCVGAPLARLEMRAGLATLFARRPDLRLAAPPRFGDSYHFHGLEALMVEG